MIVLKFHCLDLHINNIHYSFKDITLEFISVPQNQLVEQLQDAHFSCSVQSSVVPSIRWWFTPERSLTPQLIIVNESDPLSQRYSVTLSTRRSTLTIHNVEYLRDSGVYSCNVSAGSTRKQASSRLTILSMFILHEM